MTTTYRVQDPQIPAPSDGEFELRQYITAPSDLTGLDSPVVEDGQPIPAAPVSTYSRRIRTRPAEPTATTEDGRSYWPMYVEAETGTPAHPADVAIEILDGEAELDASEAEVRAAIERLRRGALLADTKLYYRPLRADWERAKKTAVTAVRDLPARRVDEPVPTLTTSEMCDLFGVSGPTLAAWVRDGRLPKPIVEGRRGNGNTARWDAERLARWLGNVSTGPRTDIYADARSRLRGKRAHHDRLAARMAR